MTLSTDDFIWYLNEIRGSRYYCPYCGNDTFTVAASEQARGLSEIGSEFYEVCCMRCGHTELFSAEILRTSYREEAECQGQSPASPDAAEPSPISQMVRRRSSAT